MNILFLLAGDSKPFEDQGYIYPKYLVEINGKPLVQHVIEHSAINLEARYLFVIRKEDEERFHFESVLKLLVPQAEIYSAEGSTRGAACTALLAVEGIDNNEPLLVINGDQVVDANLNEAIASFQLRELDGGIITFDSVHPRWSYVRLNDKGLVVEAAEKRPISNHATAGVYYFSQGKDFVAAAKEMIRKDAHVGEAYYVCPAYNEMLLAQKRVGIWNMLREQYFPLATPQGVHTYEEYLERQSERKQCE